MNGKYILLSGAASRDCSAELLDRAIEFVEAVVAEILKSGGSLVVLLGDESQTRGPDGRPRIFDWVIMRGIQAYGEATTLPPRAYAYVVMADDAWQSKMDDANRRVLSTLQRRRMIEVERIRREEYTGGEYRRIQVERADAMIGLGGGKGTYSVGRQMIGAGKPVLPIDLAIGAFSEDGEGALLLHKEMQSEAPRFLPRTHGDVVNQLEASSLANAIHSVPDVAQRVVEILNQELHSDSSNNGARGKSLWSHAGDAANKFLTITGIMRGLDFLRQFF